MQAGATEPADPVVKAMLEWIERNLDRAVPLDELAQRSGLSRYQVLRRFQQVVGSTPRQYQEALRSRQLRRALRDGAAVAEAMFDSGFGSMGRGYAQSAWRGVTPGQYRRGGAGLDIGHAEAPTRFGWLTMAATDRGVCFCHFDDERGAGAEALAREFPNAILERSAAEGSALLAVWLNALVEHLEQGGPRPTLPLEVFGTALQLRTWRFLAGLDTPGPTLSYRELAAAIDAPQAVRAVASACGANRVAVLIPCHRVLRSDGGAGGYRWGLERKRALLEQGL